MLSFLGQSCCGMLRAARVESVSVVLWKAGSWVAVATGRDYGSCRKDHVTQKQKHSLETIHVTSSEICLKMKANDIKVWEKWMHVLLCWYVGVVV